LGGATPIEIAAGILSPRVLVVGPDHATLDATLATSYKAQRDSIRRFSILGRRVPLPLPGRRPRWSMPDLTDLSVIDDRGGSYVCRIAMASGARRLSGDALAPIDLHLRLVPVPPRGIGWLELGGRAGSFTRLVPSLRPALRVGAITTVAANAAEHELCQLAQGLITLRLVYRHGSKEEFVKERCGAALSRLSELQESGALDATSTLPDQLTLLCGALMTPNTIEGLPASWAAMLDAAELTDGASLHFDFGTVLPLLDGVILRLDTLVSGPDAWRVYLRATPGWWRYTEDRRSQRSRLSIRAEDDLGGVYLDIFDGSTGHDGYQDLTLRFRPRLDPLTRSLRLTVSGAKEEFVVNFALVE
jgi:hypothetical protein